jgi:hypothetical protein
MGIRKPDAIGMLLTEAGRTPTTTQVEQSTPIFVRRMLDYYRTSPDIREIPGRRRSWPICGKRGKGGVKQRFHARHRGRYFDASGLASTGLLRCDDQ